MAFDPSTAVPINQEISFDPSTAKPMENGFDPSTAKPVDSLDEIYKQEAASLASEETTNIDTVPIVARAASGLMRTPHGKADVINKISPQMNAKVAEDGTLTVNGQPFNLSPESLGAFLYDLPGMASEATAKNIPLLANLGATVATGGMSIPAQIALQGAAMGTAEGIKELMAQGLAQEKPNIGDIALNTALGASGPVADMAFMATANGMKSLAKNLSNFTGPAKDIGPEVLNATAGIKLGVGEKVFQKMDAGEDLSKIISPENASASKPSEILNNTFFGNQAAERNPENFVNTLKYNIQKSTPDTIDSLKKMYQEIWGLSPQTLETVIKNPTKDVINSGLFADNASLTVGSTFAKKLEEGDRLLENEYGKTLMTTMQNPKFKDSKVNIASALDEMFRTGATPDVNPNGVGIFEGNSINPGYTGEAAKKIYSILLGKLEDKSIGIQSPEGKKFLADLMARNPKGMTPSAAEALQRGSKYTNISAPAAYRFIAEIKPLLEKTFEGGGLSGAEKGPLAGFMKNIRGQLGNISPEMKAMNEKYGTYQSARTFFGDGKVGNLQDMLNINTKMAQAYADPGIRTFLGRLDETLGNKELTNMVDHLGASQEIKKFFDKATGQVENRIQGLVSSVKTLADKTATHAEQNMIMSGYNSILPKDKQFLDPMWNHLIANEFQNKPLSIFKAKYIGLMALAATGMGHVGVLPALGVGMTLSSPRNISRGLMAMQRMKGVGGKITKSAKGASSKAGQVANRVILNNLLQSAKKAGEAKNKK